MILLVAPDARRPCYAVHMTALHIRRRIDSDTLRIPELRGLIGREVEIVVREVTDQTEDMERRIAEWEEKYHMRGSVLYDEDPFGPVAVDDWEALQ